jgi:uncharacterized protein YjiS (DUF1127 family)
LADLKSLAKPAHRPITAGSPANPDDSRYSPKEKAMFYDTASHRPPRTSLLVMAFRPWQILANLMMARRTRAELSRLDDYMLKDIGLSRGGIEFAIRNGHIRD